jgi:hypothetical protein
MTRLNMIKDMTHTQARGRRPPLGKLDRSSYCLIEQTWRFLFDLPHRVQDAPPARLLRGRWRCARAQWRRCRLWALSPKLTRMISMTRSPHWPPEAHVDSPHGEWCLPSPWGGTCGDGD